MKVFVCTTCSKAKKKKAEGEQRLSGIEVYESLTEWKKAEGLGDDCVKVIGIKCLDHCEKGPVVVVKPAKTTHKRVTKEKLDKIKLTLICSGGS